MPLFELDLFGFRIAPTYYGTAYALGFILGYWLLRSRAIVPKERLDDLVLFVFLGVFF